MNYIDDNLIEGKKLSELTEEELEYIIRTDRYYLIDFSENESKWRKLGIYIK